MELLVMDRIISLDLKIKVWACFFSLLSSKTDLNPFGRMFTIKYGSQKMEVKTHPW